MMLSFARSALVFFYIIVKQKWFEKFPSPHIIRICLGVLRTLGFYINFRQLTINGHQCCVLRTRFLPSAC